MKISQNSIPTLQESLVAKISEILFSKILIVPNNAKRHEVFAQTYLSTQNWIHFRQFHWPMGFHFRQFYWPLDFVKHVRRTIFRSILKERFRQFNWSKYVCQTVLKVAFMFDIFFSDGSLSNFH